MLFIRVMVGGEGRERRAVEEKVESREREEEEVLIDLVSYSVLSMLWLFSFDYGHSTSRVYTYSTYTLSNEGMSDIQSPSSPVQRDSSRSIATRDVTLRVDTHYSHLRCE